MASTLTIIDALDTLRKRDLAEKQPFKASAYAKVIRELKNCGKDTVSYADILQMKGVGEKIRGKIREIMETGQLQSAEKVKDSMQILDVLLGIYGIGPAKAQALVQSGITSIAQLRAACATTVLNKNQRIGLQYYEELLERIPRREMEAHQVMLKDVELVGSFRRNAATSGDIDVLLRLEDGVTLEKYISTLGDYILEILALGEHKCMAICRLPNGKARRLDILLTPADEYAYAMLYFTGSDRFNVAFRQYALDMGFTMNEHSMRRIDAPQEHSMRRIDAQSPAQSPSQSQKPIPHMHTEKDIFTFLGLRYIAPAYRVDGNQVISLKTRPKIAASNTQ